MLILVLTNVLILQRRKFWLTNCSVLTSFGVNTQDENMDLPSLYWFPKLPKDPYKQRFIAGSAKCSTKPFSKL